jgi:hypothetical protein
MKFLFFFLEFLLFFGLYSVRTESLANQITNILQTKPLNQTEVNLRIDKYHACLDKNFNTITNNLHRKSVLAEIGDRVELKCDICTNPDGEIPIFQWKRQLAFESSAEYLDIESVDNDRLSLNNFNLIIKDIESHDHGRYWCEQYTSGTVINAYHLSVVPVETRTIKLDDADLNSTTTINLEIFNLNVFFMWTEWTECSTCDKPGYRKRTGNCYIKALKRPHSYLLILNVYSDGVPCKSSFTPASLKHVLVEHSKGSTVYGNCYSVCSTNRIKLLTNRTLEDITLNELKYIQRNGFFLSSDALNVPPIRIVSKEVGQSVLVKCLNDRLDGGMTAPQNIRWTFNGEIVHPTRIGFETHGLVDEDLTSDLFISQLATKDVGLYKCYVDHRLTTMVRVEIVSVFDTDTILNSERIFLFGFFMVVCTFLFVFFYSCLSKLTLHKF